MSWYLCDDPAVHLLVLFYYMSLWSEFHFVISAYKFCMKTILGSSLPPVVCGGLMFFLYHVCLFAHIVLCFCFVCRRDVAWLTNVASCSIVHIWLLLSFFSFIQNENVSLSAFSNVHLLVMGILISVARDIFYSEWSGDLRFKHSSWSCAMLSTLTKQRKPTQLLL